MTTNIKMTAGERSNFRKAVTSHPGWKTLRKNLNLNSATMTQEMWIDAGKLLGIDPASFVGSYVPKARVEAFREVTREIDMVLPMISDRDREFIERIREDADRHAGMITEGQAQAVRRIMARAKGYPVPDFPNPAPVPTPVPAPEPVTAPAPVVTSTPAPAPVTGAAGELARLIETILSGGGATSEARVIELIKQHGGTPAHVTVDLRTPAMPEGSSETRLMHHREPLLLSAVNAGVPVFLVGPAGSGKTTAAANIAKTLGRPFEFTGALSAEYKLSGFIDAQGRVVCTAFRRAYENGGVFLFDEIDGSSPGAVLAFNAALANDYADFPDGQVARHPDFRVIAAGNTFGKGASRQYVGRTQLDAASLDRFATLTWDYDPALESALVGLPRPDTAPLPESISPITSEDAVRQLAARWLERVREVRAKVEEKAIRHVVSPRATVFGTRLLAAGWPWPEVEEGVLFKGLDADSRTKLNG